MQITVLTPNLTGLAKIQTSGMLSMKYDEILQKPQPKKEDYATEEEYQGAVKSFMLDTLEYVSLCKKASFVLILDRYNHFLGTIHNLEEMKKKAEKDHIQEIERLSKDQSRTFFASAIASLLFPAGFPLYLTYMFAKIGYNRVKINKQITTFANEEALYRMTKEMQNELYDFVCTLRSDYHATNHELKELKERAEKGENIMPQLLEIISPERVGLERIDPRFLMNQEEEKKQEIPKVFQITPNKKESNE